MTSSKFHFSPRSNRAGEIAWQEWGDEAFAEAQRDDKPVLLGISAAWCHWCHVMDETSYSDGEIINLINERFVAVRVDNDQRPDVNARYNMGGWPTTAFLTPGGEVMAGLTYVPPEQMRDVLNQVSTYYKENKEQVEEKIAENTANRARAAATAPPKDDGDTLTDQIYRDAINAVADQYDPVFGGFGNEPKFPHTEAIALLLHAYLRDGDRDSLHMARKTLEYMCRGGTYDQEWGGFYRYSTKRDWSIPHYEKMLEDNALLLSNLCSLYRITGEDEHRRYIESTVEYLDSWLSDPHTGAFYGSQDADEEFYPLPDAERKKLPAPYVDETTYTSWNAMAIRAYLDASYTLVRPALKRRALRALDFLAERLFSPTEGMYRFLAPDGPRVPGLLGDQVWAALAFLDAYEAAGRKQDFDRAALLAAQMHTRLAAPDGSFFDTPEGHETLGRLSMRSAPPKENALAAEVFLRIARLTHKGDGEAIARAALLPFASIVEAQGHFASGYARTVDVMLNPGAEIKIVAQDTDAAAPLRDAALALLVPNRSVRVIDATDARALEAESLPTTPSPAAYACYGTLCSAPVTTPVDLIDTTERTRQAYEATRRTEPLAGPRSERASD